MRRLDLDEAETTGLQAVRPAFADVDRVFLLTGYDVRMLARSKAAVDAAKAEGVSHVVHVGVSAAEDTTIVHFAWHQLVEAYIERSGLGHTHLRPASFMQNLRLIPRCHRTRTRRCHRTVTRTPGPDRRRHPRRRRPGGRGRPVRCRRVVRSLTGKGPRARPRRRSAGSPAGSRATRARPSS
ncbi:NmrA family NAD(P)-binding protein [Streptosporangium sp. NPDC023825]|uniref:NmrA family NAD(P)-binding protein n=1 Tax=Streptosporangium sp. NPDC023825 TaxID=3154909 RepID=UPI00343F0499